MKLYPISISINEELYQITIKGSETLLQTIRSRGLTGAKPGCLNGDCGACTVIVNEKPVKSCITITMDVKDDNITTVEGLKDTCIQAAFVDHFAFQCGYCTSGFIMNSYQLLQEHPEVLTNEEAEEWLSSNICRCTGYKEIQAAIFEAHRKQKKQTE